MENDAPQKTYQVRADHFSADVIVCRDRIVRTAPILTWLKGEPFSYLQEIAADNCWKIEQVTL